MKYNISFHDWILSNSVVLFWFSFHYNIEDHWRGQDTELEMEELECDNGTSTISAVLHSVKTTDSKMKS
jgi:hypothetical protein